MTAQDAIRQWADDGGRKLAWVAKQIPASRASIWRWLEGKTMPHPLARNRLADITGIDMVRDAANWEEPK